MNTQSSGTILAVDDIPANLELLSRMLVKRGYRVRSAISGSMALKSASATPPDLVLLDINMPEMDGYQVCQRLKEDERTRDIPVIFVSAMNETLDKVRAFETGGVDYVTKPFQFEEVVARVETHLSIFRQRREIEALRKREKARFDELSALKDQFVRMVSHDLKNPLNNVIGFAYLLEERPNKVSPADIREFAQNIQTSAQKMLRLITTLLDLSKIESGMDLSLTPIALDEFLEQRAADIIFAAQQKNIHMEYVPAPSIILSLDRVRFGQVIDNLLSNAVKYTPEGGHVRLSVDVTASEILIQVADNGFGIPAEDIPHLFEKFYRVRTEQHMTVEGTGLGLSIVQAIIEQHGGRIWVESEPDEGSVFSIGLPCVS